MSPTSFPVRVGLLGLGALSQRSLLPHFAQPDAKERIQLVAVCDVDEERARLTADKNGVPEHYTALEAMLSSASIDVVLVCTPIHLHHAHALAALQADKHVYIQKTVATSLDQAREIFAQAERRERVIVASPLQMLNPARQLAKKMIAEGAIGPIYWAICTTSAPGHESEKARLGDEPLSEIDPSWYFKAGGGPVFDMTVYAIDALVGLFGPVRRVTAFSGKRVPMRHWKGKEISVEVDDNTLLLLDFGESQFALVNGSNAYPGRRVGWGELSVFGARGALEVYSENPAEPNLASVVEIVGGETHRIDDHGSYLPRNHSRLGDPHVYADIMHFVNCVATSARPISDAARTCHVIEVIEKGYLAARTGQTQNVTTAFSEVVQQDKSGGSHADSGSD